jgi:hypothetical protein
MCPLAVDDDSHPEDAGAVSSGVKRFTQRIQLTATDEATLRTANPTLTLKDAVLIPGIAGNYFVTLSIDPPVIV